MISIILLAAAAAVQSPPDSPIRITGRDSATLQNAASTLSGTCDGRPASAVITKAYYGQPGRVVLQSGRFSAALPPTFLDGRLVRAGFSFSGLICDGTRLTLIARVARFQPDQAGAITATLQRQSVTMDLRTGHLTLSDVQTLTADDIGSEQP